MPALAKPLAVAAVLVAPTVISQRAFAGNVQTVAPLVQQAVPVRKAVAPERHPEIRKAITALERAKTDLKRADHDFGGHRVAALEACDRAIAQLRLALQYDRN
jgi:DNA-binding transcriptional regulator YdaS (Cro superfamily)